MAIEKQFEVEEKLGRIVTMTETEAVEKHGDRLRVAAIIAIENDDGTFRLVSDQTHGVHANWAIKTRDQYESPTVGERKSIMVHFENKGGARFGIKGDVESAHRLVLNHEDDWGSQACQLRTGLLLPNRVPRGAGPRDTGGQG